MNYVLDDYNNKVDGYSKEEVLAVLEKAIADGSLEGITADSGFITKLKCCVGGDIHKVAFIPQAKYNELKANGQLINGCYYFITDETSVDDITKLLTQHENSIRVLGAKQNDIISGRQVVAKSENASKTDFTNGEWITTRRVIVNDNAPTFLLPLKENTTYQIIVRYRESFATTIYNDDYASVSAILYIYKGCNYMFLSAKLPSPSTGMPSGRDLKTSIYQPAVGQETNDTCIKGSYVDYQAGKDLGNAGVSMIVMYREIR